MGASHSNLPGDTTVLQAASDLRPIELGVNRDLGGRLVDLGHALVFAGKMGDQDFRMAAKGQDDSSHRGASSFCRYGLTLA